MDTASTWARLKLWLARPGHDAARRRPDFADHGTAFALELSMAPAEATLETTPKPRRRQHTAPSAAPRA